MKKEWGVGVDGVVKCLGEGVRREGGRERGGHTRGGGGW